MVKKIKFKNQIFSKKELKNVIYDAFTNYGIKQASALADDMKELGFHYSTKAGISISIEDLKVPPTKKNLLFDSKKEILNSDLAYARGEITSVERFQKVIDTWNKTSETLKNNLVDYFRQTDPLNSIYLMAFSGARGNLSQVRQLVGMRGLMADPNGQIIDIPIIHNFREGLTITDYIMSAYGARKGVVDTALRTADSGYLTRRLIDVSQEVIIREINCSTKRTIKIYKRKNKNQFIEKIIGRTIAETIYENENDNFSKILIAKNQEITLNLANRIFDTQIKCLQFYSPLTCESTRSICQKCYGWDLSYGKLVNLGEAIGIIAAQSIGEPGTQLTMRTFHTGGIFTADPNLQIRAKKTGLFTFDTNTQKRIHRTMYGTQIIIPERELKCKIIDYKNQKNELKFPADSSIFLKNQSFVKIGDLIAELPLKNQQTIKSQKNILAPNSGEIFLSQNTEIIWLLKGEVYDIPNNSLLNNFKTHEKIYLLDNFLHFKLTSKKNGILKITKNKITKQIESINISKCLTVVNIPLFWHKKKQELILNISSNEKYKIQNLPKLINSKPFIFSSNTNRNYKTETGGQIFYPSKTFLKFETEFEREIIKKNGQILFVPIETHLIKKDKSLLLVPNKTKLTFPNTELINGVFSKTNGFVQTKETNQILHEIQIKPGEFFEYNNLNQNEIENLRKINKKIFFPGETIFEDILIEYLTLVEIIKIKQNYGIILRPIQIFNIPKPKKLIKKILGNETQLNFKTINSLNYKSQGKQSHKQSIELIESSIWIQPTKIEINRKNKFIFQMVPNKQKIHIFNLGVIVEEIIDIPNFLSKKIKKEKLKLALCVKNLDYIESQTILGFISLIPKKIGKIEKIKKRKEKKFIISLNDYKQIFLEKNHLNVEKKQMIRVGDEIAPKLKLNYSGQIIKQQPFNLKIHCGTPFFITQNTKIIKKDNDFIKQGELIGVINFEQVVTGDIVQGLPKIEEILEARKPQNAAILNATPGIVDHINVNKNKTIVTISIIGNRIPHKEKQISQSSPQIFTIKIDWKKRKTTIRVKKNDYLYVGQALNEGSINPHNLLQTYFQYYKKFGTDYEASYLSFKNIQMLLIQKVQQVYNSQGVSIADKHLEVIIRRMSSRVQINQTGTSFLLPNEIIELKQIQYINKILIKTNKKSVTYHPILLGITRASLVTDSFISAASFQETTKILTAAAIEGKIDWLRGLKENVIIGRLIPIGTGFNKKN